MNPIDLAVVTPTFRYGRYIETAIRSVVDQDTRPRDYFVVDGGSDDETVSVLRRTSSAIRWVSERDRGQCDALNKGFADVDAEWVSWLNADEFYLPGAFDVLHEAVEQHPGAAVIYGDFVWVDTSGRVVRLVPQHRFSLWLMRWYGCYIGSCATIFRRDCIPPGGLDVTLRRYMDWDLWMTIAERGGRFVHVPRPIAAFMVHDEQVTAIPEPLWNDEMQRIRRKHGISRSRTLLPMMRGTSRAAHVLLKAGNGAYGRDVSVRRELGGHDIRWMCGDEQRRAANRLIEIASRL